MPEAAASPTSRERERDVSEMVKGGRRFRAPLLLRRGTCPAAAVTRMHCQCALGARVLLPWWGDESERESVCGKAAGCS
jgi:hypothetical protein